MIKNITTKEALEQLRKKIDEKANIFTVELLPNNGPDLTEEYVNQSNETYKKFLSTPCCEILK